MKTERREGQETRDKMGFIKGFVTVFVTNPFIMFTFLFSII